MGTNRFYRPHAKNTIGKLWEIIIVRGGDDLNVTFNLANIITILTVLSMLGSVFYFLYRVARRIEKATERIEIHGNDIKMTMRCSVVCLDGLTQVGANDNVTKMRDEMNQYLINRGAAKDG